ncbi:hypothetical protein BX666DRAFT_150858 [Dichotomocladium elegans]|nr:hypothetical protein BX666DRAFT_150858 [Dichotomocladium elegans]
MNRCHGPPFRMNPRLDSWKINQMSLDAWHSLADPNVKVQPGGIGTGRLHRMGKNFKPLEERSLLQQEMADIPQQPQPQRPKKQPRMPTHKRVEDLSHRIGTSNGWGSGKLSTVPFWEQQEQPAESTPAAEPSGTTTITIPLSTVSGTLLPPEFIYNPSTESPSAQPLLEFHVSLVPGVNITFTMHEGEHAPTLVERVMTEHRLNVNKEVKQKISNTLQLLYNAKINEQTTMTVC